jgi:hypothetical protein
MGTKVIILKVNWLVREADHTLPSRTEFKNAWSHSPLLHTATLHVVFGSCPLGDRLRQRTAAFNEPNVHSPDDTCVWRTKV